MENKDRQIYKALLNEDEGPQDCAFGQILRALFPFPRRRNTNSKQIKYEPPKGFK